MTECAAFPAWRALPLALAMILAAPAAFAADPPTPQDKHRDEPKTLDAVQVRASPLATTAEDMAQPVEILSGVKLDEAKGATLGDTVAKLPGVQSSNFGAGVGRPIIRGLEGPRVGVVSGGLATQDVSTVSQDHAVTVEPFLADQIEVLKGPATLLYGSGAIGGVVNVVDGRIAESPLDTPLSGRAELRHEGVNNGRTGMMRVDAVGAGGKLVVHADGVYRNQGDYDTPLGRQANSFVRTRTGALGASLVSDDSFLGISAARYESKYGNPGEPGDPAAGKAGVLLDMRQDRFELKGGVKRDFAIFDGLRASYAHTRYEHTEFEGAKVGTMFKNDADEARLEVTHKPFGRWIGALGLQAGDRTFEAIGEEAFVPRSTTKAYGVFITERGEWDALQIDLGARMDRVNTDPDGAGARAFAPVSLSAGALWHLNDFWRLSLNLDRAERAPAEQELFADGPHVATGSFEIGDASLRKERADQLEFGMHYHGHRVEAKASIYQTNFAGFIYLAGTGLVADDLPVRQWSQQDARFRGAEGEVTANLLVRPAGKLDLRVFGDHVRAQFNGGGNVPRIVPSRLGAELRWNNQAWRASLGAVRYARQDDVAFAESSTAGYTLVDAHVAYHWDTVGPGWEVFLDGSNLTDQEARVHTSFLKDKVVLPGRNMVLGVRAFF